jgi:hypothetical protein
LVKNVFVCFVCKWGNLEDMQEDILVV